ncbi:MAG: FHA domain-containing protein [Lachnospiraceae bacterium]|jgi:hypothetical protein|nr:FHA domain-containing protein [Lachnospiraceae bacterium]
MGQKGIKKISVLLLAVCCLFLAGMEEAFASSIDEQLEEVRVEGAAANMPDMSIYCYPQQPGLLDGVKVTYGGEELMVSQALPYAQTGAGSDYYMLLDVSASLSQEYFAGMKQSILDFWQHMAPQDKITLITFGDQVQVVFQDKTVADDISEAVNALTNTDQSTCMFEAIDKAAKLADAKQEAGVRKIAVAFTDGEDFSENTSTKEEALATLKEKMIPLYAMAAKQEKQGGENPYLDSMGAFVRESGGLMEVFEAGTAVAGLQKLHQIFGEAFVIPARAKTNMVDYQKKPLAITFSSGKAKTLEYNVSYYQEDSQPPVASVKKYSKFALKVTFSEPVRGADQLSAYEIKWEGERITDGFMVRYTNGNAAVVITFEDELKNGKYEIKFHGVTDDSMEANVLDKRCSVKVKDGWKPGVKDYLSQYQVYIAGAAILLVGLAAWAIGWQMVKKRKGIVMVEGKAVLKSNLEKKHHVEVKKREVPRRQVQFCLEGMVGGRRDITVDIVQSIIVGRSRSCDVSIEDEKMSRQHFAITDRGGVFFIEDLHTTNGTIVNGQRIAVPRQLASGDRIQVGDVAMTVRW